MKTPVMTFRAYEWLRAFVEVGIALLIGSACTAWYFRNEIIPAIVQEQEVLAAKQELRALYDSRNGCNWVEVDGRRICKAKKGIK